MNQMLRKMGFREWVNEQTTRRDFLKGMGAGAVGLALGQQSSGDSWDYHYLGNASPPLIIKKRGAAVDALRNELGKALAKNTNAIDALLEKKLANDVPGSGVFKDPGRALSALILEQFIGPRIGLPGKDAKTISLEVFKKYQNKHDIVGSDLELEGTYLSDKYGFMRYKITDPAWAVLVEKKAGLL